jgi:hypothetical protein
MAWEKKFSLPWILILLYVTYLIEYECKHMSFPRRDDGMDAEETTLSEEEELQEDLPSTHI